MLDRGWTWRLEVRHWKHSKDNTWLVASHTWPSTTRVHTGSGGEWKGPHKHTQGSELNTSKLPCVISLPQRLQQRLGSLTERIPTHERWLLSLRRIRQLKCRDKLHSESANHTSHRMSFVHLVTLPPRCRGGVIDLGSSSNTNRTGVLLWQQQIACKVWSLNTLFLPQLHTLVRIS